MKAKGLGSKHLQGMSKALGHVLPYAEKQRMRGIKIAGVSMFAAERGGNCNIWKLRPLPAVLKTYCAVDVVHLFTMLRHWEDLLPSEVLRSISEKRMRGRIEFANLESGPNPAHVDFDFPGVNCTDGALTSKRQRTYA